MILVVLVLRSSNSGSSGSTSSTTISSITTWGPYHWGGGPLTRNTKPYMHIQLFPAFSPPSIVSVCILSCGLQAIFTKQ